MSSSLPHCPGVYKWHDEIAEGLNGWKNDEAAALSGARFAVLSGPVARLERALTQVRSSREEVVVKPWFWLPIYPSGTRSWIMPDG